MLYWWKNIQLHQCYWIENPEINLYKYSQLIFDKKQRQYNGTKIISLINSAETTGHPPAEKWMTLHASKNKHMILDINVKMQNYKLLEDSTGEIADDLEHDNVFLNTKDGNHEINNWLAEIY